MKKIAFLILNLFWHIGTLHAQRLSVLPKFGLYAFNFVGNGTCKETSIISQDFYYFNNPYNNTLNWGYTFGVEMQYAIKHKHYITFSAEHQKTEYNIILNRTYSLDGYWKPINGYLKTWRSSPQFYLGYNSQVYKKKEFELGLEIGLSSFIQNSYRYRSTSQTLYHGAVLDSVYDTKKLVRNINQFNASSICTRIGINSYYKNFNLACKYDIGLQNLFSGSYKKYRYDGQNFLILPQGISFTVGYRISKKAKE